MDLKGTIRKQVFRPVDNRRLALARHVIEDKLECYFDYLGEPTFLTPASLIAPSREYHQIGAPTLGQVAQAAMQLKEPIIQLRSIPGYAYVEVEATPNVIELSLAEDEQGYFQLLQDDLQRLTSTWYSWFGHEYPDNDFVEWYVSGVTAVSENKALSYYVFSKDIDNPASDYKEVAFYIRTDEAEIEIISQRDDQLSRARLIAVLTEIKEAFFSKDTSAQKICDVTVTFVDDTYFLSHSPNRIMRIENPNQLIDDCLALITDSEIGQSILVAQSNFLLKNSSSLLAATQKTLADLQRQVTATQQALTELERQFSLRGFDKGTE